MVTSLPKRAAIHEKLAATPDAPEMSANTGVMQQSEAATAHSTPAPTSLLFFSLIL